MQIYDMKILLTMTTYSLCNVLTQFKLIFFHNSDFFLNPNLSKQAFEFINEIQNPIFGKLNFDYIYVHAWNSLFQASGIFIQ